MATDTLQRLAAARGVSMDDITEAVRSLPSPGPTLSAHERNVLGDLGVQADHTSIQPLLIGRLRRSQLEEQCLTAEQAAEHLGCEASRIRQRVGGAKRSLLGFHRRSGRRTWLLPKFQFDLELHHLDGWARLIQTLPHANDTSPVVLVAWLTDQQEHLDGRSRVEHLATGADVTRLLEEAATFGVLP